MIHKTCTLTRPDNATQYAIGDAMSNSVSSPSVLELSNVAHKSDLIDYVKVNLIGVNIRSNAKQATLPQINIIIFKTSPTAQNDNSAFSITDDENKEIVAVIQVATFYTSALNCFGTKDSIKVPLRMDAEETSLYIVPPTRCRNIPAARGKLGNSWRPGSI